MSKKQPALDPFLVGLAIFFVAPWGLYLLWRHPVLKHRTKWWVSACGWLPWEWRKGEKERYDVSTLEEERRCDMQ